MTTEAQKLIGISLAKIAQSRMNRGGISLHKNLLVATVLQKARYIFMEEAYGVSLAGSQASAPPGAQAERERKQRLQPSRIEEEEPAKDPVKRSSKRRCESDSEVIVSKRLCAAEQQQQLATASERLNPAADGQSELQRAADGGGEPMEVDRITSLVSLFSFGAGAAAEHMALPRLGRSVSTPDLCSAQAKELEGIQQMTTLAMTV